MADHLHRAVAEAFQDARAKTARRHGRRVIDQGEFGRMLGDLLGEKVSRTSVSRWERSREGNPPAVALLAAVLLAGGDLRTLLEPTISDLLRGWEPPGDRR